MLKIFERFRPFLSNDIGIDLGTANTLVYVKGKGIVVSEPSVVAVNTKTGQVVAIGTDAKNMLGRTPGHIQAIRPLVDGVISDFEVTQEMISYLLKKAQAAQGNAKPSSTAWQGRRIIGPRVVVGVPSGITNVEIRAVRDAALGAGASEVHIVEEPMAAAIGIRLPVLAPEGCMIVDIGGGTTDIAVISLGGVVAFKNLRGAGDKLNSDISNYVRNEFKILIGEKTAETVKIAVAAVEPLAVPLECAVRGRDIITGLPREVILTDSDIRSAISGSVEAIMDSVLQVIEHAPPEIITDVMNTGIFIVGGGALTRGLAEALSKRSGIAIHIAADPLTAVVRGTGIILDNLQKYHSVLIADQDELPPKK